MLGRAHLVVGAAGFIGAVVPLMDAAGYPMSPGEVACGTAVAAGAAMLPDLDHPQATVSRSLGPVSWMASRLVSRIAGGHRNGTHSLLACALVGLGMQALIDVSGENLWAVFAICFLCLSLVTRVLLDGHSAITTTILAGLGAAACLAVSPSFSWLAVAVTSGYALHLAGDIVTPEGIPPLWPVSKTRVRFPMVATGGKREQLVAICCGLLCAWAAWSTIIAPGIRQAHDPAYAAKRVVAEKVSTHQAAPRADARASRSTDD